MFQLNKLVLAGVLFTFTILCEAQETVIIENQKETEFDIRVKEDGKSHYIKFDSDDLDSDEFESKLDELPKELQNKIRNIISNMHLGVDGMKIINFENDSNADSSIYMFKILKDNSKNMVIAGNDSGDIVELHQEVEIFHSNDENHEERVKVLKFDLEGEHVSSEFNLIKSLLTEVKLSPEQITQIQDVLNTK